MDTYETWDVWLKVIGGLAATVAFIIGLTQYRKGQKWQRASTLNELIDLFETDEEIQKGCGILDWDPLEESPLGGSLAFNNQIFNSALRIPDSSRPLEPNEVAIRDALDAFLDYFEKIYYLRKSGLIGSDDCAYFDYWFEMAWDMDCYNKLEGLKAAFERYINNHNFRGFLALRNQYGSSSRRTRLVVVEPQAA